MKGDDTDGQTPNLSTEGTAENEEGNEILSAGTEESTSRRRRKIDRTTPEQKARLEEVLEECLFPSAGLKSALSQELGMTPKQVKFWFQNRRTQLKNKHAREEKLELLDENQRLKKENSHLLAVASNLVCNSCGPIFPQPLSEEAQRLQAENALLQEKVDKIKCYMGSLGLFAEMPWTPSPPRSFAGSNDD